MCFLFILGALVCQENPSLKADEIFQILKKTCHAMDGDPRQVGYGLINPTLALYEALKLRDFHEAERFLRFMGVPHLQTVF
jgi:hypothetical protein